MKSEKIIIALILTSVSFSSDPFKVVVIMIDGARYSETFGDSMHTYIPKMWNLLSEGTLIDSFYNDSLTSTRYAHPALWCGCWTEVPDTVYNGSWTIYMKEPTIFEYFRKQKNMSCDECFYVLKYHPVLWLQSFHPSYGPNYWPHSHSAGYNDYDVATQTEWVMDTYHPRFIWTYLTGVDDAGHSGVWSNYLNAIQIGDSIVGRLWNKIQSDSFYHNSTYLFVTNDHGRHDDLHGGFTNHGCGCEGCRHILFLSLGPNIKSHNVSSQYRCIPDLAVTISAIFGLNPECATGDVMEEIFENSLSVSSDKFLLPVRPYLSQNYPNPFNPSTTIAFDLPKTSEVSLKVLNILGEEVATLISASLLSGSHSVEWDAGNLASGVYLYRLETEGYIETKKMILMK